LFSCTKFALAAADAGADFKSYRLPDTTYSLVQAAADHGQYEAVVKLVEAGAIWRLPKRGQEFAGCPTFDMIATLIKKLPGLKVCTCTSAATLRLTTNYVLPTLLLSEQS
jgi:hypothetical protein